LHSSRGEPPGLLPCLALPSTASPPFASERRACSQRLGLVGQDPCPAVPLFARGRYRDTVLPVDTSDTRAMDYTRRRRRRMRMRRRRRRRRRRSYIYDQEDRSSVFSLSLIVCKLIRRSPNVVARHRLKPQVDGTSSRPPGACSSNPLLEQSRQVLPVLPLFRSSLPPSFKGQA
jgi:hypothetical protein